jgi:hypothetical protein
MLELETAQQSKNLKRPSTMTSESSTRKSTRTCPPLPPAPPVICNDMDCLIVSNHDQKSLEPLGNKTEMEQEVVHFHKLDFDWINNLNPSDDMMEYVKKMSKYYAKAVDQRYYLS